MPLSAAIALIGLLCFPASMTAHAEEETEDRLLKGVISGLLGQPQPPSDAAYMTQERERLVSLLQSGEYASSRQGEPVDLLILGIPFTHASHVYTAKPIPPSRLSTGQNAQH